MATKIFSPINYSEISDNVSNLQSALLQLLPLLGKPDYKISAEEMEKKAAYDSTVNGIKYLRDKYPNRYNQELLVDELMATLINELLDKIFVVRGRLTNNDRQSIAEHTIVIAEYDLDGFSEFDKKTTNADGAFAFSFIYGEDFQKRDGKTNPDLLFKVYSPSGEELPIETILSISNDSETAVARIADSPGAPIVLMNVDSEIQIRIIPVQKTIRQTEFERLVAILSPFMGERNFADLKEDKENFQISFLAKESGVERSKIEMLRQAFTEERSSTDRNPAWAFFELANLPLPVREWLNKTLEELAALLKSLQPQTSHEDTKELAERLQKYAKDENIAEQVAGLQEASGSLVKSILPDDKVNKFFEKYARHEGDTESFWTEMGQSEEFKEQVPEIQLTLQLSQLTLGNSGLVASLKAEGIKDTKELLSLENATWQDLIKEHPEGIPVHIPTDPEKTAEENLNTRAATYMGELQTLLEVVFPTEVIKQRSNSEPLKAFLNHNTAFDFTQNAVDHYLQSDKMKWPEAVNKELLVQELRQTQRLYSITASAADSLLLASRGYTSAFHISKMSPTDFAESLRADKIEFDTAAAYHAKAVSITEAAALLYTQARELLRTANPAAVGTVSEADKITLQGDTRTILPSWENLFGQIETCECEHCRSVYSPAAYFVDLLHVLLGQNNGKARNEIFRRRPDLKYTKLSCQHTDTLIPYIDLVNEILETYVAQEKIGNDDAASHAEKATVDSSSFSEDELVANPQHPNGEYEQDSENAYIKLAEARYPLHLPFDLPLETVRQFLLDQNSSRYELMKTFGDAGADACHAEGLGLSAFEYTILAGKKDDGSPQGVDWTVDDLYNADATDLNSVRAFLDATDISYVDLIALTKTRFLNADSKIILALIIPSDISISQRPSWQKAHSCDLDHTYILDLDSSVLLPAEKQDLIDEKAVAVSVSNLVISDIDLIKFNRFIRLWKKLGCSIEELDMMLTAVDTTPGKTFTTDLLNNLSELWQYKAAQKITTEQAVVLISHIPANGDNSLYQRLFLNKAIQQIDTGFELNADKTDLLTTGEILSGHIPAILAAFRLKENELKEIAEMMALDITESNNFTPQNELTLGNLSRIYRAVVFAKINGLTIHDLFLLKAFLPKPDWNTINDIIKNQDFIDTLKAHDVKASALAYLFADVVEQGDTLPPKEEAIDKSEQVLTDDLKKLDEELSVTIDTITAEFLSSQLKKIVEEKSADKIMDTLIPSNYIQDEKLKLIKDTDYDTLLSPLPQFDTDEYKNVLNGYISSSDIDIISKKEKPSERLLEYWLNIKNEWINYLRPNLIKKHIVTEFKLEEGIIDFVFPYILPVVEAQYTDVYKQLSKFLWLVKKFNLSANEVDHFQINRNEFEGFVWNNFAITQLPSWLRIAGYCRLRNSLPKTHKTLLSIFKATGAELEKTIVAVTGFSETNVNHFVTDNGTGNFKNELLLLQLQLQAMVSDKIGVDIAKLTAWSNPVIDTATAQQIKFTLKAKYDEASWVEISSKVHNTLRNQQRDALVGYLLHNKAVTDELKKLKNTNDTVTVNDLYSYFLIDVEMDAIVKTSRLKQAISSVQLFVQRCIMNWESLKKESLHKISPADIDAAQWNWMKNYRVWEANRKVFLYPENWIEPELRDGKSPFFKELESELLQAEVTTETVETAIQNYLYKLDDVARLDMCGTYEDTEAGEFHVFGRTFNNPPIYYYRKLNLGTHEWTPWEKVQLDIQGNEEGDNAGVHLIPVVWNRRLYLFWPVFTEKADKERQEKDRKAHEKWENTKKENEKTIADWRERIKDVPRFISQNDKNVFNDFNPKPKLTFDSRILPEGGYYNIDGGYYTKNRNGDYELIGQELEPPTVPLGPEPETNNEWLYWEIKLAWSEYKQKRWTPKKVSASSIKSNTEFKNPNMQIGLQDLSMFRATHSLIYDQLNLEILFRDEMRSFYFKVGAFLFDGVLNKPIATTFTSLVKVSDINILMNRESNLFQGFGLFEKGASKFDLNLDGETLNLFGKNSSPYKALLSNFSEQNIRPEELDSKRLCKFFYVDSFRNYYASPRGDLYSNSTIGLGNRNLIKIVANKGNLQLMTKPLNPSSNSNTSPIAKISIEQKKLLTESKSITAEKALALNISNTIGNTDKQRTQSQRTKAVSVLDKYLYPPHLPNTITKLDFKPFFHPYITNFIKAVNKGGLDTLLVLENQLKNDWFLTTSVLIQFSNNFETTYQPNTKNIWRPYPSEDVDFSLSGAYSLYNWELFFHIPMLLANRLSKNQKFEEAMRWYQFVFDPTTHDKERTARRYWQVLPLRNTPVETLEALMQQLNKPQGDSKRLELEEAIKRWRENPFNPHLIARMRLAAYQKNVLMKYLDNLVAWSITFSGRIPSNKLTRLRNCILWRRSCWASGPKKFP